MTIICHRTSSPGERTARFYAAVGLPEPAAGRVDVEAADLPRLRGRLLAAGAAIREESPTALSFRDPSGVRVTLTARR
jgi:hypothetical protein